MKLLNLLRSAFEPEPLPAPEMLPVVPVSDDFSGTVPTAYALARIAYPFLPPTSPEIETLWQHWSPAARAAFVLDYVARVYAGVGVTVGAIEAKGLPVAPTVVLRTLDHPDAHTRSAALPVGTQKYSLWFETDCGTRVEIHMGEHVFGQFVAIARGWQTPGRLAS